MQGEGRWSSEALQAMDTHLWLLQRANQCEADGHAMGGRRSANPVCLSGQQCEMDMGPHLDLNSHLPLPHGWEQFLDLQTGQVYYIDWKRCRRSYMDPRMLVLQCEDANDIDDVSECMSDANNCNNSNVHDPVEASTKLITTPMLQEDWDLMEARGWMSIESNEHSEITSEVSSPNHANSLSRADIRNSPKLLMQERSLSSCGKVCV